MSIFYIQSMIKTYPDVRLLGLIWETLGSYGSGRCSVGQMCITFGLGYIWPKFGWPVIYGSQIHRVSTTALGPKITADVSRVCAKYSLLSDTKNTVQIAKCCALPQFFIESLFSEASQIWRFHLKLFSRLHYDDLCLVSIALYLI